MLDIKPGLRYMHINTRRRSVRSEARVQSELAATAGIGASRSAISNTPRSDCRKRVDHAGPDHQRERYAPGPADRKARALFPFNHARFTGPRSKGRYVIHELIPPSWETPSRQLDNSGNTRRR